MSVIILSVADENLGDKEKGCFMGVVLVEQNKKIYYFSDFNVNYFFAGM